MTEQPSESDHSNSKWYLLILLFSAISFAIGIYINPKPEAKTPVGPKAQEVADILSKPLPLPEGAKLLMSPSIGKGYGGPSIRWKCKLALDVTKLDRKNIDSIRRFYLDYFHKNLIGEAGGGESGNQSLAKLGSGDFITAFGANWTFCIEADRENEFFDLEFSMEVMDFDSRNRIPVKSLGDPVKGQRVAWIIIDLRANNLLGTCEWPEE